MIVSKSKFFTKRNSLIAAFIGLFIFFVSAYVGGLIDLIVGPSASWLKDHVIQSIKTSPLIWIISLASSIIVLVIVIVVIGILRHNSKENSIELEMKDKELDDLHKQLEKKNQAINELETKITTFLQSDNLLADKLHTGIHRVFSQSVN